ncbi:MAG: type II secretion system F family protein, partial [Candidatus Omnitrophica bacterium]|nr:type II secretion system F family protein [Candidatus Omnitrophota bacterium]
PRVSTQQLVIFSRQLATMVASGIPIVGALEVLSQQIEDRTFRHILRAVTQQVQAGASLSEAFAKHPRAFSEFFANMVKAGESSGRLDEILDRLAGYLEKADVLKRKVQSSLFYPALVSLLAFSITTFLVVVVVPKFKDIFTSLGGKLPMPTQLLLTASDVLRQYFPVMIGLAVMMAAALRMFLATPIGRAWFDGVKLHVPLIGPLLQKVAIARFARTLGTLSRSGVPILTSLEIVAKTVGNTLLEQAALAARSSIREGANIADPLAKSRIFPPMVTRMIAIGEKTGELERMLSKIAEFYENEVDAAVNALTSLIEPIIITVLGLVIGSIVIALFLPVFKISQLISPY